MGEEQMGDGRPPLRVEPLDYATPNRERKGPSAGNVVAYTLLGLFLVALIISILIPSIGAPSPRANRVKCASNLRQIGQGILLYANDNNGAFPPRLDLLITNADLNPEVFVCPSSNDDRATGPTTQALLADFAKPGRCSYVYLGAKMNMATVLADTVIACEDPANHAQQGMNVLFGDGHVEWFAAATATQILAELKAGQNPPPSATQPAGAPGQ